MSEQDLGSQQQTQNQKFGDITMRDGNVITISQTQYIQISIDKVKERKLNPVSPYVGLKRFELQNKDLFFGRHQLIVDLIEAIAESNFVLLLGASGSGKSSVVRAGLIPHLSESWGTDFCGFTLTPYKDPFESLYISLASGGRYTQAEAEIARKGEPNTFSQVIKSLKKPSSNWLFFIDQFEELFTLCQDHEKRDNFVQSIIEIANSPDSSVKIVLAMRADFLDRFSSDSYLDLGKIAQDNIQLIGSMRTDELRLAIEQPAAKHGVVFEEGLVEEIIKDVQGQAGSLPLLQYALDLLWQTDNIEDRILNTETYRTLGGVRGALEKRVNDLYISLKQEEQVEVKQIFLRLVDVVGSLEEVDLVGRAVSRRASLSDFKDDLEKETLKKLIDNNLVISSILNTSQKPLIGDVNQYSTVEIAHEALLSSWKTLQTWIDESKEVIIINNRLLDDVLRWKKLLREDESKAIDELWGGTKLSRVIELQEQKLFDLTLGGLSGDEIAFVKASTELRDRLQKEKEEREQKEKKLREEKLKATQRALIAIIICVVGIGFAGSFAWWQTYRSQQARQRSLQTIQDISLGISIPTPELVDTLPDFFETAQTQESQGDIGRAIAYYGEIITQSDRLVELSSEITPNQITRIDDIRGKSQKQLIALIEKYKIQQELRANLEAKDFQAALDTTYDIVINDTRADIDRNGTITQEESKRIPCEILDLIEVLWRELTNDTCGWYGPDGSLVDDKCTALDAFTLSHRVFERVGFEYSLEQLDSCGINFHFV